MFYDDHLIGGPDPLLHELFCKRFKTIAAAQQMVYCLDGIDPPALIKASCQGGGLPELPAILLILSVKSGSLKRF